MVQKLMMRENLWRAGPGITGNLPVPPFFGRLSSDGYDIHNNESMKNYECGIMKMAIIFDGKNWNIHSHAGV